MGSVNPALIAAAAAVLMVQAGLAKRMLAWRPRPRRCQWRGRRWRP
jgi:hypothetical protein